MVKAPSNKKGKAKKAAVKKSKASEAPPKVVRDPITGIVRVNGTIVYRPLIRVGPKRWV